MPLFITPTAAGQSYANPLVSVDTGFRAHVKVDVSLLTTAEVDSDGYIKPGVMLTRAGILVGAAPAFPFGVVVEAARVCAVVPVTTATLAAETADPLVAVVTHGTLNRDVVEDCLGRALTANEIAGIDAAGSHLTMTTT